MKLFILFLFFTLLQLSSYSQRIWGLGSVQLTSSEYFNPGMGGQIGFSYDWKKNIVGAKGNLSDASYSRPYSVFKSRAIGFTLFYGYKYFSRKKIEFFIGPSGEAQS